MRPAIVILTVTVLLGGCVGGERPTPSASDAASAVPAPTRSPGAVATGAPGDARVEDPRGDVADPSGQPPARAVAAADVVAVAVEVTDDALVVRFELAGPPPQAVDSLLWSVRTERDGDPVLTVSAQQVGPEVFAAVYDWTTSDQRQLPVEVAAATVTVRVPRSAIDDLGDSWSALVQLDGAYEDSTPLVPLRR